MRKGALIVGLAAIALLALVWAQRRDMGGCDIDQAIITPDGHEFHFVGPRIVPGSPDLDWPLESGDGLPQIEHLSQEIYGMPGALYKGTIVKPRVLTVVATVHGLSYSALMDMKARMQGALRWDRGAPGEPSIYRITVNGVSRDLRVHYDSAVERRIGRPGRVVVAAIRLISFDVFWTDPATQEQVLDWGDSFTVRHCMGREDGTWTALGPPTVVAAGPGGTTDVFDTAVDPTTGDVYFAGDFDNWNGLGVGVGCCIVRWDVSAQVWVAVGGGLNERVQKVYFGPDGILYVGGVFTDAGGDLTADYLAQYNPATDTFSNIGGGPGGGAVTAVAALVMDGDGILYVGGSFTNWQGAGNNHLVQWNGAAWSLVGGVAPSGSIRDGIIMPSGNLVVTGAFATIGALTCNNVGEWNGANWAALNGGVNNEGFSLAWTPDGTLYLGGLFTTANGAMATPVNYIARWSGSAWSDLDGGMNSFVVHVEANQQGELWAGGLFTQAGSMPLCDRLARWNGYSWLHMGIDLPGAASVDGISFHGDNVYFGFDTSGTAYVADDNVIINRGNGLAYPIIEIKNAGTLQLLENKSVDQQILSDLPMQDGEVVTIDLSSGVKSCESTWRGNRLGDILPASDMATFCLESAPRAQYGGVQGANLITVFITDADPRESGDDNAQLSGWDLITGITQDNTDLGRLYVSIVFDGVDYHVELYRDAAKGAGDLVGHTADYAAPGAQAIVVDNASGLGGSITIDAVVAADTDIQVWFTIVTLFWSNRWWDLDTAVTR